MIKKDVVKLIDSICDNFSNALTGGIWAPVTKEGVTTTFCNYFVNGISRAMGYGEFTNQGQSAPFVANRMVILMEDPSGRWLKVSGEVAQQHANAGVLAIAGWQNPGGHGHVCVIRPGNLQMSQKWNKLVPRVANVGKDVFINKTVSYAFLDEPSFFVLKEMI